MKRTNVPRIRALLQQYPNGLTVRTIADALGIDPMNARTALQFYMVDAYIKAYAPPVKGHNHRAAVWALAQIPKNAPYPKRNSKHDDGASAADAEPTPPSGQQEFEELVESCWAECGCLRRSNAAERLLFATAVAAKLKALDHVRINTNDRVAVDHDYLWRPIETCPLGVKVQLLGKGGVAVYGQKDKSDWWTHWAPLPKLKKEQK